MYISQHCDKLSLGPLVGLGGGQARVRVSRSLVLKLSKSGSGVWAPDPLSLDQNLEVWFPQNDTKPPKVFRIDKNWPKERPVSEEIPTFERKWAKLG